MTQPAAETVGQNPPPASGVAHVVRIGAAARVVACLAGDGVRYPRGTRVICRTERGLEMGEVLAAGSDVGSSDTAAGVVLRRVTVQDDLLLARLEQSRQAAIATCEAFIQQRRIPVVLLDVEPLFDGQTLCFAFWGDVPDELDTLTRELTETYEATAHVRRFCDLLAQGCGPDCGSAAAGCHASDGSPAGCGSCSVAQACGLRHNQRRP